ncbi:MAG: hypothetical protein AVO35_10545 [Candidatus Aegiribacteria sp. MLS_C]|nr:MAG: hypothetical protein AVO35_10545 [Candidatus Aegiribacteria sp. MLS_C]
MTIIRAVTEVHRLPTVMTGNRSAKVHAYGSDLLRTAASGYHHHNEKMDRQELYRHIHRIPPGPGQIMTLEGIE